MSSWNSTTGTYNVLDSTVVAATGETMVPFDFGSTAALERQSDLTLAGNMMDCGECHVGGGAMEFVPNKVLANRVPLRNIATTPVNGGPALDASVVTSFNYFIDQYDVDGDGVKTEAQYIDYAKTGVMEMDCLMCHLPGYKYEERRAALRDGKIDATRAIGAGIAADNGLAWDSAAGIPDGYGTTVVYDESKLVDMGGFLGLPLEFMANVAGKPDSNNCANCHANEFSVDWKKRGDHWAPEGQYDFQYEVHYNIGCTGCHERMPTAAQPGPYTYGLNPATHPTMGVGLLGHDPAKGDAPYSGLYNKNDKAGFKSCEVCHITGGAGVETYGAPNPTAAHAAAGLTAKIVQGATGYTGVPAISHIDLMDCSACHSRKANSYNWGNTGAPMIDATGADHEGRLTDHENDYVIQQNMTDNTSLAWYKGKLLRVTPSNTMFWRDKEDVTLDANQDGGAGGMDALLMTQVLKVNEANGWGSLTEDGHGTVTAKAINDRVAALTAEVHSWTGGTGALIRFSMFHVNFKNQHGVSPASMAWGKNGCSDCHGATAEFYNGTVNTVGTLASVVTDNKRTPYTKVNGSSQPTDWHPGQVDRMGTRSIATQISNVATTCDHDDDPGTPNVACVTHRDLTRSESMYEGTFMGLQDFADSYTGASIAAALTSATATEKGWLMQVEVKNVATGAITKHTKAISANVADVAGLLSNFGATFTSGFNFTLTDGGAGNLVLAGKPGYQVRLTGADSNAQDFGLIAAAYKATPWTGIDGNSYAGRTAWVSYLNTLNNPAAVGIGVDPVAVIAAATPATAVVGVPVNLVADTSVNTVGSFSYSWISNDVADETLAGPTVSKTFNQIGTWTVTLKVVDEEGKLVQIAKQIQVTPPAPVADIALTTNNPAGQTNTVTFSNLTVPHTMLYIIWGDGTKQQVNTSDLSAAVDHKFLMYSKYLVGGVYQYKVTLYVYNGSVKVETKQATISINP